MAGAECYVGWADTCKGSAMQESHWLDEAIAHLRNIRGTRSRHQQLKARLVNVQAGIRDEMGTFEIEVDLSELADHAKKAVSGCSLIRALASFAQLHRSPKPEDLRAKARKAAQRSPLLAMMSSTTHDSEGKVVARSPGVASDEASEDGGLRRMMLQEEAFRRGIAANGLIEPARLSIQAEHPVEERDLLPLMQRSPFVPPEREMIFTRAFARFFGGDHMSAIHLLFPQLENSMRHLLKHSGCDPTSLKADRTQQDIKISLMIKDYRLEIERIFGPAVVLEIENLFDAQDGPSVRHSVAHGLLNQSAFDNNDCIYACWFVFRLCVLPLLSDWQRVEADYDRLTR